MALSNAFQQLNKPEEALKVLNKFLEADPDNPYVLQVAADMYEKSGDYAKALEFPAENL